MQKGDNLIMMRSHRIASHSVDERHNDSGATDGSDTRDPLARVGPAAGNTARKILHTFNGPHPAGCRPQILINFEPNGLTIQRTR